MMGKIINKIAGIFGLEVKRLKRKKDLKKRPLIDLRKCYDNIDPYDLISSKDNESIEFLINIPVSKIMYSRLLTVWIDVLKLWQFEGRKQVVDMYDSLLDFNKIKKMKLRENTQWNYSYYPVIFESEEKLLEVQKKLNENDIIPRRYFYPSLNTIEYTNGKPMPISESIASRILCLPLYVGLEEEQIFKISQLINE